MMANPLILLVRPARFELATYGFVVCDKRRLTTLKYIVTNTLFLRNFNGFNLIYLK